AADAGTSVVPPQRFGRRATRALRIWGGSLGHRARRTNGKRFDESHVRIGKGPRLCEVIERHVEGIVTPEQLLADDERRHPEHSTRACPERVVTQALLHRRISERLLR